MPNFKSMSFKMAVLQGGGQNLPPPCVCYPKDPRWNRVDEVARENMFFRTCDPCFRIILDSTLQKPENVKKLTLSFP